MPSLDRAVWSFAMHGRVQNAAVLSYNDLNQLPSTTINAILCCATEPHHPEHLIAGEWQGVALVDLMADALIDAEVNSAIVYSADGSQLALPAAWLEHALLATMLNGRILTPEQGYPARLIIPGLTACQSPRWVERIEFVNEITEPPQLARNIALITSPQTGANVGERLLVEGLVIAPAQAAAGVELSIDDGPWFTIPMQVKSNHAARWSLDWTPPGAGQYALRARTASSSVHQITIIVS
ncbi:MAG: molybdopterin-dependent oxidoreductase [Anaerolineae bacterium]|nr:molybdopterin-dependent oxidoreductase [Anaerolineae bacterium]